MGRVLASLERLEREVYPRHRHPLLGRPSVHASLIAGGQGLSTYPDRCRLQVERRTLPTETPDDIAAEMEALLAGVRPFQQIVEAERDSRNVFLALGTTAEAPVEER